MIGAAVPFGDFTNVDPQLIYHAQSSYLSFQSALQYVRDGPHHEQTPRLMGAMCEALTTLKRNWERILVCEDISCILSPCHMTYFDNPHRACPMCAQGSQII